MGKLDKNFLEADASLKSWAPFRVALRTAVLKWWNAQRDLRSRHAKEISGRPSAYWWNEEIFKQSGVTTVGVLHAYVGNPIQNSNVNVVDGASRDEEKHEKGYMAIRIAFVEGASWDSRMMNSSRKTSLHWWRFSSRGREIVRALFFRLSDGYEFILAT